MLQILYIQQMLAMAERISKIIDLDICGIDIMTTDITKPLSETGGAVLRSKCRSRI